MTQVWTEFELQWRNEKAGTCFTFLLYSIIGLFKHFLPMVFVVQLMCRFDFKEYQKLGVDILQ